jgi:hypothetical protein
MRAVVVHFGRVRSADQVAEHTPGLEILDIKSDNLRNCRARSVMGNDERSDSRSGGESSREVHFEVKDGSDILKVLIIRFRIWECCRSKRVTGAKRSSYTLKGLIGEN